MFKTVLVSLMALLAYSNAAPYVYGSPFYASYPYGSYPYGTPAVAAAYAAPALTSAAYTAPSLATASLAGAALPAAAYPAPVPYPLSGLSGYTYGSSYSVQELGPVVAPPSAPLAYTYAPGEYIYGR